uniref:Vitelline membrane outer layer 1 homolog n=1 Tax=Rhinopithecus roxellana TaxID=61622 RepID=A0A2K6R441_RHIRO
MEPGGGAKRLRLLLLLRATHFPCGQADGWNGYAAIIEVTNGGPWGDWAWPEMCPDGFFASGFSLKVEGRGNVLGNTHVVESQSGSWGEWSEPLWCRGGAYLVAFLLRVEAPTTLGDNTAANNVRFRCSHGEELQGPGLSWGDFGDWSDPCPKGVCGLQTNIQGPRGFSDDTALNDVRLFCCLN